MATIQKQEQTKNQKIANGGEDVEKREPLCVTGGNVKWSPQKKKKSKQYDSSSKN